MNISKKYKRTFLKRQKLDDNLTHFLTSQSLRISHRNLPFMGSALKSNYSDGTKLDPH